MQTFCKQFLIILCLLPPPMLAASDQEPLWRNSPVVNHHAKVLNFYQDLIKGKTVAINFIFTTCSSSCPLATAVFKQVQNQLGAQQVQLISISVDPGTDTPERLNAFAQQFKIKSGWSFITGEEAIITALLEDLDAYTPDKILHTNMVLVGNDATHNWIRLFGLPSAEMIINAFKNVTTQPTNARVSIR
ncbi:MAG: SCO family protein [Methylococcales bacterium]